MTDMNLQIEMDELKAELIRMQARIDMLEEEIDSGDDMTAGTSEMSPEPVQYVEIGSNLAGEKKGNTLVISGYEPEDTTDEVYNFYVNAEEGTATGAITIRHGSWTRMGLTKDGISNSTVSLSGSVGDDVAIDDDSAFSGGDGSYYIIVKLAPDLPLSSGERDPNLQPTGLSSLVKSVSDWNSDLDETAYGLNYHRVIAQVVVTGGLVTSKQQIQCGDIDDTLALPDTNTNAFSNSDPIDDSVAQSLEFNSRGEIQLRGVNDPATNTVTSEAEWLVCIEADGGTTNDKPVVKYIDPDTLNDGVDWCDLVGDTSNPCFDTIVTEIVTEIESGELLSHTDLDFSNGANDSTDKADNEDHDARYPAVGSPNSGDSANTKVLQMNGGGYFSIDDNATNRGYQHVSGGVDRDGATDADNGISGGIVFDTSLLFGSGEFIKLTWAYGV